MWPNTYWLNTNKNSPLQDWGGLGIISCAKMSKKVWRKITLKILLYNMSNAKQLDYVKHLISTL